MKKYIGFTLAETLITLGIIGVVAAMTMPILIGNYQKQTTVNKIKKFYTNINQVMQMAIADNGEYSAWSYETSEEFYNKYVKPYIKNVDKTDSIHMYGDFSNGIRFVFSDGTQAIFAKNSYFLNGDNFNTNTPVFVFYPKAQKHSSAYSSYLKNPTRERFYFVIRNTGTVAPPNMYKTRQQNIQDCKLTRKVNNEQTKNGNIECATVIYKDGWKIEKDYPW